MTFKRLQYDSLDSTNLEARRLGRPGLCIVANEQIAGKGRFHRSWDSALGGVYVSLTLEILPFAASLLSVLGAVVVRRVIASFGAQCEIKWPNDLSIEGRKVAGILIESVHGEGVLYIVGIGINTHNALPASLNLRAASLGAVDNAQVVDALCSGFEDAFAEVDVHALVKEYTEHCLTLGNTITIEHAGRRATGTAVRLTPEGYLVLETASGAVVIQDGTIVS